MSDQPKPEEQTLETPPVVERYEKVAVNFTNCRQPDGSYIHNELSPEDKCHICGRPFLSHSSEQFHECARKQQEQRADSGVL